MIPMIDQLQPGGAERAEDRFFIDRHRLDEGFRSAGLGPYAVSQRETGIILFLPCGGMIFRPAASQRQAVRARLRGLRRRQRGEEFIGRAVTLFGVFFHRFRHDASIRFGQHRNVGLGRQMFHQHLAHALAVERYAAGEHFVENDAQGVNVDFFPVPAVGYFGGHVMHGADAFGVSTAAAARDELREAVIADLDHAVVGKDVRRLQIAMHDAVIVQISHGLANAVHPSQRFIQRQAARLGVECVLQRQAADVFHHHPGVAVVVLADVEQVQQIGMFQVQALPDAAQFDVQIPADELQRDFLARVAHGVIDFAEAALAHAAFEGVALQRPRAPGIQKATVRRLMRGQCGSIRRIGGGVQRWGGVGFHCSDYCLPSDLRPMVASSHSIVPSENEYFTSHPNRG